MAAYVIASLAVRDTAWRESYSPKTAELIRKHGGKVLAPVGSGVELLEGKVKLPTNVVILEFPSKEQAKAWYNDPEYGPMIKLRQTGDQHISYIQELHAGDIITIRTTLVEIKEKSIRFVHEMAHDETNEVVARTTLKAVHLDTEARKSCAFAEEISAKAASILATVGRQ